MAVSIPEFWKLLIDSRLYSPEQCQQLGAAYIQRQGAAGQGDAKPVAEWLVAQNALSRYQTAILLAGRPGPFFYGDYKVYDRVEAGRLAGLFRAVHAQTNHPVLLQFLSGPFTQDARQWATVAGRLLVQCGLNHPQLQRCHEVVDLGAFKFLVLENLASPALEERLAAGPLPPPEACRTIRLAAQGLLQLHQYRQAHGDVRPASLWFEQNGNVKLWRDQLNVAGPINFQDPQLAVRADYLAPEFMQPGKPPDGLTDIYALGCTFYQSLTGRPPFTGGEPMQKLQRHATEPIQPLEQFGVPGPLAQLVSFMMAKNPAMRIPQIGIIVEQLAQFVPPNLLHLQPLPLPTLANYELQLRQKAGGVPSAAGPHAPAQPASFQPPAPSQPPAQVAPPGRPMMPPAPAAGPGPRSVPVGPAPRPAAAGVAVATAPAPIAQPMRSGMSVVGPAVATAPAISVPAAAFAAPSSAGPQIIVTDVPRSVAARVRGKSTTTTPQGDLAPEAKQAADKKKMLRLAYGLGGAALLLISLVVILNLSGKGKEKPVEKPPGESVAGETKTPDDNTQDDGQGAAVALVTEKPTPEKPTPEKPTKVKPTRPGADDPKLAVVADEKPKQVVVPDDGKLPWAAPTSGDVINFQFVPPGGQVFFIVRPAEMLGTGEGERVARALGPDFAALRSQWEAAAGMPLTSVEQLLLSLHENGGNFPRATCVVRLRQAQTPAELLAAWGNPAEQKKGSATVYSGKGGWTYYLPPSESGKVFVMGAAEEVEEVPTLQGKAPALRREIEGLRKVSDVQRHVSILFAPNFFFTEGQKLFTGREAAMGQLDWFLGEGLKGGLFSAHFAGDSYLELRMASEVGKDKFKLASELKDRLDKLPDAIEARLAASQMPDYWRGLAMRYPSMVRYLHDQARVATEGDHALVNSVLPGPAAHNLVLGGELAIASGLLAGSVTTVAAAGPARPAASVPKNVEEALNATMTIAFEQDSLEFAMANIAKQVNDVLAGMPFEFKIRIIGDDLKIDGITKNQSIRDFNQPQKKVREILTAMVMKANPVTTVKQPTEADQKLVWVVAADPDNPTAQIVLVTTRQVSEKKYKLPPEFQGK